MKKLLNTLCAIFLGLSLIPTMGLAKTKDKDPLHIVVQTRVPGSEGNPDVEGTSFDSDIQKQQRTVLNETKESIDDHETTKVIGLIKEIRKSDNYKAMLQTLKESIKDCPAAPGFATAAMSADLTLDVIVHAPKPVKSYKASLEFPVGSQSGSVAKECPIYLFVPYADQGKQTFTDKILSSIQACADANKKACVDFKNKEKQASTNTPKPIAPVATLTLPNSLGAIANIPQ